MDLFTFLIENEYYIHNYIYNAFKIYLKQNNIKEKNLYYNIPDTNDPIYNNTYSIIRDFIDHNFNIYKNNELQIHVKNESRYIIEYLKEVYMLEALPF